MPPRDELPARVPYSTLLARTADVAFVLTEAVVFADGCLFKFEWTLRRGNRSDIEWQCTQAAFSSSRHYFSEPDPAAEMRLGIALSDGQRLVADSHRLPWPGDEDNTPNAHTLRHLGGSGSSDENINLQKGALWLWPLPPAGPLTLVFEWPAFGIAQTEFQVDATVLRSAAERARPLWD